MCFRKEASARKESTLINARQPFKRADRVADLLRQIVSEILMTEVPHIGLEGVTITGVKMTDDLQHARVFYRVLDPERRADTKKNLDKAAPTIRKLAGKQLKMRYTPFIHYEYDESVEYGHRIDELLSSIKKGEQE